MQLCGVPLRSWASNRNASKRPFLFLFAVVLRHSRTLLCDIHTNIWKGHFPLVPWQALLQYWGHDWRSEWEGRVRARFSAVGPDWVTFYLWASVSPPAKGAAALDDDGSSSSLKSMFSYIHIREFGHAVSKASTSQDHTRTRQSQDVPFQSLLLISVPRCHLQTWREELLLSTQWIPSCFQALHSL